VKALLPARGDLLPLLRVGSRVGTCTFRAFGSCEKNELTDEAKAAVNRGLGPDFPRISPGEIDDG
jgi:hypothetical protein